MSALFCGPEAISDGRWTRLVPRRGIVAIVTEPRVGRLYASRARRALKRAGVKSFSYSLPSGEAAKSWSRVERLLSSMLKDRIGRDGALVAVGGGAVTDAAGFAAAIYLRGLPWISIPTTLLGQLDSGIGGKTGINFAGGKNLAGSFHEPSAIVCDTGVLATLPARERLSGLGEALKYGLTFDPALWRLLVSRWPQLMAGDPSQTAAVVRRGVAWKLRVVAKDLRETKGQRELLNFGHTLGHALESAAGLGRVRHGEAVIWGMRAALRLSVAYAGLPLDQADRAEAFLEELPMPSTRGIAAAAVFKAAKRDKKARAGRMRFVLLEKIGKPIVTDRVPEAAVKMVIKELL